MWRPGLLAGMETIATRATNDEFAQPYKQVPPGLWYQLLANVSGKIQRWQISAILMQK